MTPTEMLDLSAIVTLTLFLAMQKQNLRGKSHKYRLKHLTARSTLILMALMLSALNWPEGLLLGVTLVALWAAASVKAHLLLEELNALRDYLAPNDHFNQNQ